jgi:hypothetical protein
VFISSFQQGCLFVHLLCHLNCCFFFVFPSVHGAQKATKLRIASFVHGSDGLGNQDFPPPATKPVDQSAAAFLVEQANLYPGQVSVVALGPLTNLALVCSPIISFVVSLTSTVSGFFKLIFFFWQSLVTQAVELDPAFPEKIGQIIILGGAYSVNGNVNPAAEANVRVSLLISLIHSVVLSYHLLESSIMGSCLFTDLWGSRRCRYRVHLRR